MAMTTDPRFAVNVTVRGYCIGGTRLLEITKVPIGYIVQISSTGTDSAYEQDLKQKRAVYEETSFVHKPSLEDIKSFLSCPSMSGEWKLYDDTIETMLGSLPPANT